MNNEFGLEPGRLLLYWDYELQIGADQSRYGLQKWGREDHHQTEILLNLLDEYGVRCTFAVVGFAAQEGDLPYHAPAQVREIAERGHEIACHTWKHEWVPGLTYAELVHVLRKSKEQLEAVTGRSVISFATPWNAPTRFLRKTAIGLYDWRRGCPRIDIPTLCRALHETGYKTARIAYEPFHLNLVRHSLGRIVQRPAGEQWINGILCFKVGSGGFATDSLAVVQQAAKTGKDAVIYAHPHSLVADNDQNIRFLVPFFEAVKAFCESGKLVVRTPGEIYQSYSV